MEVLILSIYLYITLLLYLELNFTILIFASIKFCDFSQLLSQKSLN